MTSSSSRPYEDLVQEGMALQNDASRTINLDVPRTGCLKELEDPLRRVLLAIAAKNPAVGYVQSMNYIAAALLESHVEEETFETMCALLSVLPLSYYDENLLGVQVDTQVLKSLVERYMPTLHWHFDRWQIDLSILTLGWFSCLFVNSLPRATWVYILNHVLQNGSEVLLEVALSFLMLKQQVLLRASDIQVADSMLRWHGEEDPGCFVGLNLTLEIRALRAEHQDLMPLHCILLEPLCP